MLKILEATCHNGELVLNEKLSPELEGKKLKITILEGEEQETTEDIEARRARITRCLEHAEKYSFQLPLDYKFNRDEIYDR
jgi:hypothetical protein